MRTNYRTQYVHSYKLCVQCLTYKVRTNEKMDCTAFIQNLYVYYKL